MIIPVHCIWKYMNCSSDDARTEQSCRDQFSTCSDNVDEEDEENIQGLPDVPGLDLPSLIESGNGKILITDGKKQLSCCRLCVLYSCLLQLFRHTIHMQEEVQRLCKKSACQSVRRKKSSFTRKWQHK